MSAAKPPKRRKIRTGMPYDEATRAEHTESVTRPKPNASDDPTDPGDAGPHVERVGMPTPDES